MPLSEVLRDMGVRQEGDPILRQRALPFALPDEVQEAADVEAQLLAYVPRLKAIYPFTKGVGIAAPQIGIARAIAIVQPPDSDHHIALVNPTVVWRSKAMDTKAEGCLSFFDVRGEVPRPLAISVRTTQPDGTTQIVHLEKGWARLTLHEIDHLYGTLYSDHLLPGETLMSTGDSRDAFQSWDYDKV